MMPSLAESRAIAFTVHLLTSYRRTWMSSAFNSFLLPVGLLAGFGWSLGRSVHHDVAGHSYLSYVATGLLAYAVIQVAAAESSWQVFGCFEWSRIYHAVRLTPARVSDILAGHLLYVLLRGVLAGAGFFAVMAVCRVPRSFASFDLIAAVPLLAAAIAAPVFALAAAAHRSAIFDVLFRLGIVPMSLVSGIYFPIEKMPVVVQAAAWILPLSHGVDLVRMCTLGGVRAGSAAGDAAVLAAWAIGGFLLAHLAFKRRLSD